MSESLFNPVKSVCWLLFFKKIKTTLKKYINCISHSESIVNLVNFAFNQSFVLSGEICSEKQASLGVSSVGEPCQEMVQCACSTLA